MVDFLGSNARASARARIETAERGMEYVTLARNARASARARIETLGLYPKDL